VEAGVEVFAGEGGEGEGVLGDGEGEVEGDAGLAGGDGHADEVLGEDVEAILRDADFVEVAAAHHLISNKYPRRCQGNLGLWPFPGRFLANWQGLVCDGT